MIAETVGGSIPGFVEMMNQYVASLGCVNTHFANPSGLHSMDHYASARDIATITREAMQDETFRSIAGTTEYALPRSNINRSRMLTSRMADFVSNASSGAY